MAARKRRAFTREFKEQAVRLVREGAKAGKSLGAIAKELDLTDTSLREWVRRAEIDEGKGPPGALTTVEREELTRLRRENKVLQMERDILKKRRPSSPRRAREVRVHLCGEGLGTASFAGSWRSREAATTPGDGVSRPSRRSTTRTSLSRSPPSTRPAARPTAVPASTMSCAPKGCR
jgi:transposase